MIRVSILSRILPVIVILSTLNDLLKKPMLPFLEHKAFGVQRCIIGLKQRLKPLRAARERRHYRSLARRMGGAERYPSISSLKAMGFAMSSTHPTSYYSSHRSCRRARATGIAHPIFLSE